MPAHVGPLRRAAVVAVILILAPVPGVLGQDGQSIAREVAGLSIEELADLYEAGLDAYVRYGDAEGRGIDAAHEWIDLNPQHYGRGHSDPPSGLSLRINAAIALVSERWDIPLNATDVRSRTRSRITLNTPVPTEEGHFRFGFSIGHFLSHVTVERRPDGTFWGTWAPVRDPTGPPDARSTREHVGGRCERLRFPRKPKAFVVPLPHPAEKSGGSA